MCKVFDTFVGPVENVMIRLESRYFHNTSRELTVAAITRRDGSATRWIRGPSTGQCPRAFLNQAWLEFRGRNSHKLGSM